jgi:hypothetical protein
MSPCIDGADESSEEEEIEDNAIPPVNAQPQVQAPNVNPPRR